ncbi:MAG: histidine kinase [Terriglobia bacterium]|nr:MAG: histidine kinase [Terriglobia bacterium]
MVSSRRLLMVDGDTGVHELLSGLLQRDEWEIDGVFEGREALERLRGAPYDLVVAGEGRNGLGGLKLLRRIQAIRPGTKVILTGEPNPSDVLAAFRARAYSYFHKPLPAGPVSDMVHQATRSSSWQDDIKVLSGRPEWVTLEARCKMETVDRATQLVRELEADLPHCDCEDVAAAFRELLMNAIEHGGKSDARKRVRISLLRTSRSLIVHMRDPGKGFSLERIHHAAVCNPEDSPTRHAEIRAEQGQRPGGFGILMASKLVDELLYNERGNEVVFVKNFT